MKKEIILNNKLINYTIKKSNKARNLRLSICSDNGLEVTIPFLISQRRAENFIREKSSWIIKKLKEVRSTRNILLPRVKKQDYPKCKIQAFELVNFKLEQYNRFYNYNYNRVCIRDQKTRWGSCSSQKNLNFNFKIIFLNSRLVDYIVVHELCHLKELNHSRNFWNLVSQAIPDYKELRGELKWVKM